VGGIQSTFITQYYTTDYFNTLYSHDQQFPRKPPSAVSSLFLDNRRGVDAFTQVVDQQGVGVQVYLVAGLYQRLGDLSQQTQDKR
jgi:hypothetical protein